MRPYVIARIFGGIGNQLFCYAAARRLALANRVPLRLDACSGFVRDGYRRQYLLDQFAIAAKEATVWESFMHPAGRARRGSVILLNQLLPFERRWYIQEVAPHRFDTRLWSFRVERPTYVSGYWQSERYFADVMETIRSELAFTLPHSTESARLATEMEATESVSIHLRTFAEVPSRAPRSVWSSPLPLEYYSRAAGHVARALGSAVFFCFSDNVEWARAHLRLPWEVVYVDVNVERGNDGAVDDLWLMSRCRHHVVSNSTFSWWGAWLGRDGRGVTIAPEVVRRCDPDWVPSKWLTA